MSNSFRLFLLFSVFVTGLIVNSAFAEETTIDVTDTIDMTESSNSTSTGDETMAIENEIMVIDDITITEDEMAEAVPSPLKQIKEGVVPENVVCKEGLGLVFKLNGQPACVKTISIEKLIAWGWAK